MLIRKVARNLGSGSSALNMWVPKWPPLSRSQWMTKQTPKLRLDTKSWLITDSRLLGKKIPNENIQFLVMSGYVPNRLRLSACPASSGIALFYSDCGKVWRWVWCLSRSLSSPNQAWFWHPPAVRHSNVAPRYPSTVRWGCTCNDRVKNKRTESLCRCDWQIEPFEIAERKKTDNCYAIYREHHYGCLFQWKLPLPLIATWQVVHLTSVTRVQCKFKMTGFRTSV